MAYVVRKLTSSRGIKKRRKILRIMGAVFFKVSEKSYICGKGINPVVLDQIWGIWFELMFLK